MDGVGNPLGDPVDLLAHEPPNAQWENGFRPVDVDFDDCGRLLVSSDGTKGRGSSIVRITYNGKGDNKSKSPTSLPTTLPSNPITILTVSPTPSLASLPTQLPSASPSATNCNNETDIFCDSGTRWSIPMKISGLITIFAWFLFG